MTGDVYGTYVSCENVDSIQMRSAYDLVDAAPQIPPVPPEQGKRTVKVKPCVRKSRTAAADCRARLRASWKKKRSFTVKGQVTTRDKAGNRTRKTKLIKVSAVKAKKAAR